ncbi:MAG: muconolactone Delta-isomerase family protein [Gammaproteobacteria bacterium]
MEQNFVVEMSLGTVPPDAYQELGHAEMEYTQEQMAAGKLTQLLVTKDHKRYWMVFAVRDEGELRAVLEGFPLHRFFDYSIHPVVDMVAASAAGVTDPNLD